MRTKTLQATNELLQMNFSGFAQVTKQIIIYCFKMKCLGMLLTCNLKNYQK